jgi:hypothetical protein
MEIDTGLQRYHHRGLIRSKRNERKSVGFVLGSTQMHVYIYISIYLCVYVYIYIYRCTSRFKKKQLFLHKKNSNSMLDINCLSQVCQFIFSESDHGGRAFWGCSSTASQLTGRLVFLPFTYILHISIIPHDIQHQQKPHICWLLP